VTRFRKFLALGLLIALVIAMHDATVPHGRGLAARGAVLLIDEYRAHVSPRIRGVVRCRFEPSCSLYGRQAILEYGFGRGTLKTAWRLARCGPWTKAGTRDLP
jgi:putative component of membrane protein insertase Oxa1/YidC/SpoIIIJ protein YidD